MTTTPDFMPVLSRGSHRNPMEGGCNLWLVRFWQKVDKSGSCWEWRASTDNGDNMQDKKAKGRCYRPIGEKHPNAKLTWAMVAEIRASNEANSVLAERFNVSPRTIRDVRAGKAWSA